MSLIDDLLVVVPARGGSTGIPGKNIKPLAGLPLIGWCAEALKAAGMEKARRILSTDDGEIAEVARSLGFEVPFLRPPAISTGTASLNDVALHVIDWIENTERGEVPGIILILMPTQPFRDPRQLRAALEEFDDPDVDGVMSVYDIERSLSMLFRSDEKGRVTPIGEPVKAEQRQQVEPILTPSGCFFYVRADAFREQETLYTRNVRAIVTPTICNIDLDTPTDWAIAEAVFAAGLTWRKPRNGR